MTATRVPLFLVRGGLIVDERGPRDWRARTKDAAASAAEIKRHSSSERPAYVYDVDGVEAAAADHQFYQRLEQAHAAPWIHPGCRTPEDAMDAFFAGAEAITVELQHMGEDVLDELSQMADGEIHLGVPAGVGAPRPSELQRLVLDHNLAGVVLIEGPRTDLRSLGPIVSELRDLSVSRSLLTKTKDTARFAPLLEGLDRLIAPEPGP